MATGIELHCSVETAVAEGITLTKDELEELQNVHQGKAWAKGPIVTMMKVKMNWKNRVAGAACQHAYTLQQAGSSSCTIPRFSLKAGSERAQVCVRAYRTGLSGRRVSRFCSTKKLLPFLRPHHAPTSVQIYMRHLVRKGKVRADRAVYCPGTQRNAPARAVDNGPLDLTYWQHIWQPLEKRCLVVTYSENQGGGWNWQ